MTLHRIGTPGPWVAGGRPLTRAMVEEVAAVIARHDQEGIHPRAINEELSPDAWPGLVDGDKRVRRALQLLRKWGVARWQTWGWVCC